MTETSYNTAGVSSECIRGNGECHTLPEFRVSSLYSKMADNARTLGCTALKAGTGFFFFDPRRDRVKG
jgi:hypothetical protein